MLYLGIDLGGTNIAVGLVNENAQIIEKVSVKTNSSRHYSEIVLDMVNACKAVCEKAQIDFKKIKGVGIGCPGIVDSKSGCVVYSNNIVMANVPLREEFNKYIDLPVYMNNDANCAALGEVKAGAAKGKNTAVMITLGTGVGGGIVINGKIYEGENGVAGEIGHTVIVVDGEVCTCGRSGCFEAYSSATALIRKTKQVIEKYKENSVMWDMIENNIDNVSGKTAFAASKQNDMAGKEVVEWYIKHLACGIVNTINSFRPEVIIIGGGVCNEKEYLTQPLKKYIEKYSYGAKYVKVPDIVVATLGNAAGIIGAAMLCE